MAAGTADRVYAGVDPGGTTGVVVVKEVKGKGLEALAKYSFTNPDRVVDILRDFKPRVTVVEVPAKGSAGAGLGYMVYVIVVDSLATATGSIQAYKPGQWKPVAKAQHWNKPKGWNRHEGDALNLIRFYLWQRNNLMSDLIKSLTKEG